MLRSKYECTKRISTDFKFYVAFESALCEDYVTEKLAMSYQRDIIPIVYGGANYSRFVPPHSFIDVGDFEDVKQLAEYLKFLSENPKEYVKYFWWQKYYTVRRAGLNYCELCEKLYQPIKPKFHSNIER